MIEFPTVFILGAGASAPFGFPLGRKLLTDICNNLDNRHSRFKSVLLDCGFKDDLINAFKDDLRMSMQSSVDLFLKVNSKIRPEYIDVGKAAIACALISYEKPEVLCQRKNKQSWYEYLFSKLETDPYKFHQNKLSVITFNYDRSFEQFLFSALKKSYRLDDDKAAQIVHSIPIIHVYGQLGAFPFLGLKNERYYTPELKPELVNLCASCIEIINDDKDESPKFSQAHELIKNSHSYRTCFLGFGFNEVNVKRLIGKFKQELELSNKQKWATFFGSAYKISGGEMGERKFIKTLFGGDIKLELGKENEDIVTYLRNQSDNIFLRRKSQ